LPSSLLLLLLLLPPEPSSLDSLELSPEVDPSGDAAVPSRFSSSLSCERKEKVRKVQETGTSTTNISHEIKQKKLPQQA
jgi:hypothetical protein